VCIYTYTITLGKERKQQMESGIDDTINWVTGSLGNYPLPELVIGQSEPKTESFKPDAVDLDKVRVQQSDLLKPILMDIARYGLNYAYKKELNPHDGDHVNYKYTTTKHPKKVIIVGAGMAGLSAGYELSKVGHDVEILETQTRFGGRVKTFGEKEGFAKHCYADGMKCILYSHHMPAYVSLGGAMRLPGKVHSKVKEHFLTDYYVTTEFGLRTLPFNNSDDGAWLKFYGDKKIKVSGKYTATRANQTQCVSCLPNTITSACLHACLYTEVINFNIANVASYIAFSPVKLFKTSV